MGDYAKKLQRVEWQKKRLEVLNRFDWLCAGCGSANKNLHVHHYWYEPRQMPWDYPDDCFGVLCDECHAEWHDCKLALDRELAGTTIGELDMIRGIAIGFRCISNYEDFFFSPVVSANFVAAFIRGFWPPVDYIMPLIDDCLLRIVDKQSFWFSESVEAIVPASSSIASHWLSHVKREAAPTLSESR